MNASGMLRHWARALLALIALLLSPSAMAFTVDTSGSAITGLWWNPNESGWGVNVVQQYDIAFVTMFVYDGSGNPTWYVASSCAVAGAGCSGTLYRTTGGQSPTATWVGPITAPSVGSVTLSFSDVNTGTLSYTINGVSASKAIERQIWRTGLPATVAFADYAGSWAGSWRNNTFGSSGPATLAVSMNSAGTQMSWTIAVQGNVFGGAAPPPETFLGTVSANRITLSGNSVSFGQLVLNIDQNGVVTGSGTNVNSPNVSRFDFTGTWTRAGFNLSYTATLTSGGTATGSFAMTKQ